MTDLVLQSCFETLMMVALSMGFGTLIGMGVAFILVLTKPKGLCPQPLVFHSLGLVLNIVRSIPFIILIILMIPFTRFCVGTSIGTTAASLPLILAAGLLIGRLIEDALNTVPKGVIEVGKAMGASKWQILWQIQWREALPLIVSGLTTVCINVIGFSAMAGTVGGGGLGDLAIRYGYQRYDFTLLLIIVIILVVFVQIVQMTGNFIAGRLKK